VNDLASAHLAALKKLEPGQVLKMNLGTGRGTSVQAVIEACRKVTGHEIPTVDAPRRAGDPPALVADSTYAQQFLSWSPKHVDIESIVQTAWKWHQSHPRGYEDHADDHH
jgi:UDP-glucose 4-epimerase